MDRIFVSNQNLSRKNVKTPNFIQILKPELSNARFFTEFQVF